ncbi:MAG: YheV family putative metal-binding protein [Pseudomonadota bacterium]
MSDPTQNPRKFIAGAVCPNCQAVDRIVIEMRPSNDNDLTPAEQGENQTWRVCVACDFSEQMTETPQFSLPNTIKDRPPRDKAVVAQTVTILDPDQFPSRR